jgi:ATP-dependent DNA helicase RecG
MYPLETPIDKLSRVGKATAGLLNKLGVYNLLDLIYYFPFRYDDFSQLINISKLAPNQTVTIKGKIILISNRRSFRKRMTITEALVEDETGTIKIVWFNQPFLTKNLKAGDEVFISGKVEFDRLGLQFVSPAYEKINGHDSLHTAKIVPVYFLSGRLTVKQLRFLVSQSLTSLNLISDWLPEEICSRNKFMPLQAALKEIHFPTDFKLLAEAQKRLKFDELFLIQLNSQLNRRYLEKHKAPAISFKEE